MSFDPHSVSDQAHVPPVTTTQPSPTVEASAFSEEAMEIFQRWQHPVNLQSFDSKAAGSAATVTSQTQTASNAIAASQNVPSTSRGGLNAPQIDQRLTHSNSRRQKILQNRGGLASGAHPALNVTTVAEPLSQEVTATPPAPTKSEQAMAAPPSPAPPEQAVATTSTTVAATPIDAAAVPLPPSPQQEQANSPVANTPPAEQAVVAPPVAPNETVPAPAEQAVVPPNNDPQTPAANAATPDPTTEKAHKKLTDLLIEKLLPAIEPALRNPVIRRGQEGLANTGDKAILSKTELAVQDIVWKDFRSFWDAIYKGLSDFLGTAEGRTDQISKLYTALDKKLQEELKKNPPIGEAAAIENAVQVVKGQLEGVIRDRAVIDAVTTGTRAKLEQNAENDQNSKIDDQVRKHQSKEKGADSDPATTPAATGTTTPKQNAENDQNNNIEEPVDKPQGKEEVAELAPVTDLAATQTTVNATLAFVNRAVTGGLSEAEFSELAEDYLAESKKFITDEIKAVIQKELTASAQRRTTTGFWGRARLNPKYWTGGSEWRKNREHFKNVAEADIEALPTSLNANPAPATAEAAPAATAEATTAPAEATTAATTPAPSNDAATPAPANDAASAQTLPAINEDEAKPQGTAYKKSLYKAALSGSQRDKTRKTYTNELIKTSASTVAGKLYDQNSEIIVSDDILNRALLAFYNGLIPGGGGLKGEYKKKAAEIGKRVQAKEKDRLIRAMLEQVPAEAAQAEPAEATEAEPAEVAQKERQEKLKTALGMSLLLKEQLKDAFGEEMSSYQGRAHEAKVVAAKEALKGFKSSKYTKDRQALKKATLDGATKLVNGEFTTPQPAPAQQQEQAAPEQAVDPVAVPEQEQVETAVPAPTQEQVPVATPSQEPEAQEAPAQEQAAPEQEQVEAAVPAQEQAPVAAPEQAPVAAPEQARPELNLKPELNAEDLQKAKSDALDATLEAKTLNAFFDKVAALMQPSLQLVGDTLQLKASGKIPLVIDGGFASVNIGIKLKAIKLPSYTRVSPEITIGLTGSVLGALDLTGAIGGSLAGSGASVREAFSMISYAMYRRAKNSKIVPKSLVDSLWSMGGASKQDDESVGDAKKREHSEWAGSLEEKMTHKWAGESGVMGSFKATTNLGVNSINPALDPNKLASVGGELELKGFWGERYRKRSKKATTITREDLKRLTVALSGSAGAALGGSFNGELNWEWTNNKLSSIDGTVIVGATIDFGKLYSQGTKDVGAKISQSILAALMTGAVPAIKNLGTRADAQLRAQKQLTEPEATEAAASEAADPVAANAPSLAEGVGAALATRVTPPAPALADANAGIELANLPPNPAATPAPAVGEDAAASAEAATPALTEATAAKPAQAAAVGDAAAEPAAPAPAPEATEAQKFERDLRKAKNTAEDTKLKHYGQALGKDTDWAGMGKNYASAAVGAGVGITGDLAKTLGHAGVYGKDVTAKYPGVGPANPGIHASASPTLPWDTKLAINLMFLIGKNIIKEPRRWEVDMIASTDKTTAFNAYFVSGESKKSETFYYKKLKA